MTDISRARINAFVALGDFLRQFKTVPAIENTDITINEHYYQPMLQLIESSQFHNGWFTPDAIRFSLSQWADALTETNLLDWLNNYQLKDNSKLTVGLILAGNIPLVGFHDFLCVLVSGHQVLVKRSSNDQQLIALLSDILQHLEPEFKDKIRFTEEKLEGFDAIIATGSNNTARYFEYYFSKYPSIIRKNRNSVAILTGKESKEELKNLGHDIFQYYGLGCRNVSKIFVPKDYDFTNFFESVFEFQDIIKYEKYANNYDYNKAVFLMSNFKLWDNGFLTLKEDQSYSSPISSVFYEYYSDLETVFSKIKSDADKIQCVVGNVNFDNIISFGDTQKPRLHDYADNIDTMKFLTQL